MRYKFLILSAQWAMVAPLLLMTGCLKERRDQFGSCINVLQPISLRHDAQKSSQYCGYFYNEYSYFLIFSSQEDLGKFNLDHALSVDFDSCFNLADTRILDQFNGRRVMIEGRYHSSSMATNGAAAGELGSPQKLLIGNMSISCVDGKIRGL